MSIETLSEQRCFDGIQGVYRHTSTACGGAMKFSVFQPPQIQQARLPVLFFLAGLTCNEETFMIKAGAQRLAAELGLMLVATDTSPRDTGIANATGDWEFGEGAGFYLDATEPAYATRFRMREYVVNELPAIVASNFAADISRSGICGHSMGGHGALTLALTRPDRFRSVSALAPIVAPSSVPWGIKAFTRYLGSDRAHWADYDACALVKRQRHPGTILIDQGMSDKYLETQLQPELFEQACNAAGQSLMLRRHAGYDHYYWFIQTFIDDHLRHHHRVLMGRA
ncbi:MAG: S-formylglutathione hydrolase [Pseudomonadota bacterium]|nr:S-formylglutathione hydrolase [Pseudomonadota bacterium]